MVDVNARWEVIHGDCREVTLPSGVAAIITDPPYGIGASTMTLGIGQRDFHRGKWDAERVQVEHWLTVAPKVAVWGGNYYTDVLPTSNDWLIWHKVNDGRSFSECEVAWSNLGCNMRHLSHHWAGEVKQHPTQKPIEVMRWTLRWAALPPESLVVDPYCGAGTTGVACMNMGLRFIGIEREEKYVEIARRRIADAAAQTSLFDGAA